MKIWIQIPEAGYTQRSTNTPKPTTKTLCLVSVGISGMRPPAALKSISRMSQLEVSILPNEILNLDEIPEEDDTLKELRAIRDKMDKEYEADPETFEAKLQNMWTPGFTYGIPGRTFKNEEEWNAYIESERIPRD